MIDHISEKKTILDRDSVPEAIYIKTILMSLLVAYVFIFATTFTAKARHSTKTLPEFDRISAGTIFIKVSIVVLF